MTLSSIIKRNCSVCGKVAIEVSRIDFGDTKLITLECGHLLTDESLAATDYSSIVSSDGRSLMPFQIEGVKFAESANARVLIADEQGLGKTVQGCALLKLHMDTLTPCLVVTKESLVIQTMWEIFRWTGNKKVQVIKTGKERAVHGFDFYITTYDLLKNENMFDDVEIKTIWLDECQKIKNHLSGRAKAVQKFKDVEHAIATSGTPILNNAGEYFTVLNLLQPTRFPTLASYLRDYCDSYETFYGWKVGGLSRPEQFKEDTKDFIIRRTQEEVLPDLFALKQPRKFHHVELDRKVNKAYAAALRELEEVFYAEDSDDTMTSILAIYSKMRQITGVSKTTECTDYVTSHMLGTDRRICIFAHHHMVVDLLEQRLNEWMIAGNYPPVTVYRAGDDRKAKLKSFESGRVLIASTQASGEGFDGLQFLCSDMILLERQWNPGIEEQVEGRLGRIGQTKPVNFIYMIASETIDEYFTELVEAKRAIVASTLDNKTIEWDQSSLMRELASILVSKGGKKWSL